MIDQLQMDYILGHISLAEYQRRIIARHEKENANEVQRQMRREGREVDEIHRRRRIW